MTDLAHIEVEEVGTLRLVRVHGEVDISNAGELAAATEGALANGWSGLILDLSSTRYMDSAGVELLFRLAHRLQTRRLEFRVVVPMDSPIRAVLELTGLPKAVTLEDDRDPPASR